MPKISTLLKQIPTTTKQSFRKFIEDQEDDFAFCALGAAYLYSYDPSLHTDIIDRMYEQAMGEEDYSPFKQFLRIEIIERINAISGQNLEIPINNQWIGLFTQAKTRLDLVEQGLSKPTTVFDAIMYLNDIQKLSFGQIADVLERLGW